MTIAAAYLVSEGVVFGTDSTTTVSVQTPAGSSGVLQLLNNAQKIFEVGKDSRIGVCTWGAGSVGDVSHRTIIARLAEYFKNDTTVKDAAESLVKIVQPIAKDAKVNFVGYYLGGWDPKTHDPVCYKIEFTQGKEKIEPLPMGLCTFSGNPQIFSRVFRGFDPNLPPKLFDEIKRQLPPGDVLNNFNKIFNEAFNKISAPLSIIGYKDLPIREAIDFIHTYLHITIKATKYAFGAPGCGGPIEIGFISTDRPFRWVRHKSFSTAIMEEEADYDIK